MEIDYDAIYSEWDCHSDISAQSDYVVMTSEFIKIIITYNKMSFEINTNKFKLLRNRNRGCKDENNMMKYLFGKLYNVKCYSNIKGDNGTRYKGGEKDIFFYYCIIKSKKSGLVLLFKFENGNILYKIATKTIDGYSDFYKNLDFMNKQIGPDLYESIDEHETEKLLLANSDSNSNSHLAFCSLDLYTESQYFGKIVNRLYSLRLLIDNYVLCKDMFKDFDADSKYLRIEDILSDEALETLKQKNVSLIPAESCIQECKYHMLNDFDCHRCLNHSVYNIDNELMYRVCHEALEELAKLGYYSAQRTFLNTFEILRPTRFSQMKSARK